MAVCLDFPNRAERLGDAGFVFSYPGERPRQLHATDVDCRVCGQAANGPSSVGTANSRENDNDKPESRPLRTSEPGSTPNR